MTRRNRWTNLAPAQVREPIRAQLAADGLAGELHIYDVIDAWGGEWGVNAAEVSAALAELGDVSRIDLRLNSPGGDYFEGVTIAHALARHPAQVAVHVDGLAASAASVIAMGGDRIVMGQGSQMMIHEASSMAWGTASEMRRTADMLDQTNDDIAQMYARRTGGDAAAWRQAIAAETWYTAAQAVTAGLADEVAQLPQRAPSAPDEVAAMIPRQVPSVAASAPEPPAQPVAPPPAALPTAGVDLAALIRSAVHRDRTTA